MGAAVGISVFLVITTFLLHYTVFRWLSGGMSNFAMTAERRILIIWLLTLSAHVAEVALYAAAYAFGERTLEIGSLDGLQIVGHQRLLDCCAAGGECHFVPRHGCAQHGG